MPLERFESESISICRLRVFAIVVIGLLVAARPGSNGNSSGAIEHCGGDIQRLLADSHNQRVRRADDSRCDLRSFGR